MGSVCLCSWEGRCLWTGARGLFLLVPRCCAPGGGLTSSPCGACWGLDPLAFPPRQLPAPPSCGKPKGAICEVVCRSGECQTQEFRPVQSKRAQFSTAQPSITQPTGAQYSPVQLSPVEPSSLCPGHRVGEGESGTHGTDGWAGRGPRPRVGGGNRGPRCACSVPLACPPENGYESTFHVTCVLPWLKPILAVGGWSYCLP